MNKKFCTGCGNPIDGDSKFCEFCGTQITIEAKVDKKKKPIFLYLILLLVLGGLGVVGYMLTRDQEESPASSEEDTMVYTSTIEDVDLSDFIDQPSEEEIIEFEGSETTTVVQSFSPVVGSKGTLVTLYGEGLNYSAVESLTLNDMALPILRVEEQYIETTIPLGATSGELMIQLNGEGTSLGYFEVETLYESRAFEILVDKVDEDFEIGNEYLNVIIPSGTLEEPKTLTMDVKAVDYETFNTPLVGSDSYTVLAINLEDQHQFNHEMTFEFQLPEDYQEGYVPLVMYYDENEFKWKTIETEVTDRHTFLFKTDHLTDFLFDFYYSKVMSPDGYFTVYYKDSDKPLVDGYTKIEALAKDIGKYADIARKKYDALFQVNLSKGQDIIVLSGFNEKGGNYRALDGLIQMPGQYKSLDSVKTTTAHELFHLYQNMSVSSITMGRNKWLTEATAEYASYKIAFDMTPHIWAGESPKDNYNQEKGSHMYSMAAFLDYLFDLTGTDLASLWQMLISSEGSFTRTFENYYDETRLGKPLSMVYAEFWRMAFMSSEPKYIFTPEEHVASTNILKTFGKTFTLIFPAKSVATQSFNRFILYKTDENVPERILKITSPSSASENNTVYGLQVFNVTKDGLSELMVPKGLEWDEAIVIINGPTYKLYTLQQGDHLVLATDVADYNSTAKTLIREVKIDVVTKSVTDLTPGKEQTFKFKFSDIFEETESLTLEVDFGDGEILSKDYGDVKEISVEAKHVFKDLKDSTVKAYLYDTTGGKKELIGKLIIPISTNQEIEIIADSKLIYEDEYITFTTNVQNKDYQYEWDFGYGENNPRTTSFNEKQQYKEKGYYTVSLNVSDQNGNPLGAATLDIEVMNMEEESSNTSTVLDCYMNANPSEAYVNESIDFEISIEDENYTYEWTIDNAQSFTGSMNLSYAFDTPGTHHVSANIYKENVLIGTSETDVNIIEEEVVVAPLYEWHFTEETKTEIHVEGNPPDSPYDSEHTISNGSMSGTTTYVGKSDSYYSPPIVNGESLSYQINWNAFSDTLKPGTEIMLELSGSITAKNTSYFNFSPNATLATIGFKGSGPDNFVDTKGEYMMYVNHDISSNQMTLFATVPKPYSEEDVLVITVSCNSGVNIKRFYKAVRIN
ncbi:MAG: PKD domain-containing protein [Clostridia bacterium]|nr:PKD domain-containing protein [Clostridia bacterium]